MTVLGTRALNRATLARQYLLDRADTSVCDAVAHLCGMQAQEPQEPFVGLWSRLRAFEPAELDEALTGADVVRTHLMRRTVHLVTAEDALAWRARHEPMLRQRVLATYRHELAGIDLDEVAAAGRAVMADERPRTMARLVEALHDRWPAPPRRALGELLVAALIPMAQLPPRGLWQTTAGVRNLPLAAWLGRDVDPLPSDETIRSGSNWCDAISPPTGLLPPRTCVLVRSRRTSRCRQSRPGGARHLPRRTRPGAPRPARCTAPAPDTPAPVRFLPAFDNAILGYRDRSRIIDDAHLGLSVAGHRVVLVDGRVRATWTVRDEHLHITPLRPLAAPEGEAVRAEAHALTAFLDEDISSVCVVDVDE